MQDPLTGVALGIDYGTSNTVAVLRWPDGRVRPVLFDGSPLLPSAVYREPDGTLLAGRDAVHSARLAPASYEPYPKSHAGDGALLLGGTEVPVGEAVAATLRLVSGEARRAVGAVPDTVILTYPAAWAASRRGVLHTAASLAGLPAPRLVPEPVAAAAYFTSVLGHRLGPGQQLVVYDLGAGTFDVSAVRRTADGYEVVDVDGLASFGGLDLDEVVVQQVGAAVAAGDPDAWRRLTAPATAADRRAFRTLWDDARAAKETLSRRSAAGLFVPLFDRDVQIAREQFEAAAGPKLDRAAELTARLIERVGVAPDELAGIFLVGGSSRVPLAATTVHRATRVAPDALDQPETVVAEGALRTAAARVTPDPPAARVAADPPAARVAADPPAARVVADSGTVAAGPVPSGHLVPSGAAGAAGTAASDPLPATGGSGDAGPVPAVVGWPAEGAPHVREPGHEGTSVGGRPSPVPSIALFAGAILASLAGWALAIHLSALPGVLVGCVTTLALVTTGGLLLAQPWPARPADGDGHRRRDVALTGVGMLALFGTVASLSVAHEFWWLETGYGYGEDLVVVALAFCLPGLVLSVVFARLARRAPVVAETRSGGVRAMWWSAAWWLVPPTLTTTIMCMVSLYSSGLYWLRWFGLVVPVALMVVAAAVLVRDWRRRCGPPVNRAQVGVGAVALVLFGAMTAATLGNVLAFGALGLVPHDLWQPALLALAFGAASVGALALLHRGMAGRAAG
ncbi:Hsp70 family protein [Actinocatenispora comari]|uniref:Hsp70 protein n=1 Tax=Actinocatenispora comari TaxID=2807577 RepID=A0A8J4AA91_9ACTN|nr:Hsp70 family protein [Actinocatenispora comari]GIL26584.1 hypothetical protein NUM_18380 [Actinocatenispora comari]